ncbi:hypothetical protein [Alysiella crassa]|uniref:hypothetical protein n=1 Tax=Alysiella crassa TaxID=153491 RepID=UPI001FD2B1CE|nr:hypothetical protein [Alysiella crassa]UOP07032.1 hypothetical protein LVJ80_00640 [Alysiella crassa]
MANFYFVNKWNGFSGSRLVQQFLILQPSVPSPVSNWGGLEWGQSGQYIHFLENQQATLTLTPTSVGGDRFQVIQIFLSCMKRQPANPTRPLFHRNNHVR